MEGDAKAACKRTQQLPTLLAVAKRLTGFQLCATTPNNTQQFTRNNMQRGVLTDATCNIQQCWEMLANNVASV